MLAEGEISQVGGATQQMDWDLLTHSPLKATTYEREPHFREGYADARDVWGSDFPAVLHRAALFMVKPEGRVTSDAVRVVREFLAELDYEIVAVRDVWLDRLMWRELWRYQLTSATLDRFLVSDVWLELGPALLLAVRSGCDLEVPASVYLSGRKGSATLANQLPGTLRSRLRQANRMMSFVHVADEPADVLRELAILLDRPEMRTVLERYAGGSLTPASDKAHLDEISAFPQRSLDPSAALDRVQAALEQAAVRSPVLDAGFAAMRAGERISWREFGAALAPHRPLLDLWDVVILGTTHIEYDEPGTSKLIENPAPDAWLPRAGSQQAP